MGINNIFVSTNSRPGDPIRANNQADRGVDSSRIRITPPRNLLKNFLIKARIKATPGSREEIMALSRKANVRCLECGWKYNLQFTNQCPICASERTYLLNNGTFFTSALTISAVIAFFCGFLILAYVTITS